MLATLITGVLILFVGIICFILVYKPLDKKKSFFDIKNVLLLFCRIFIILGWQYILLYGFSIDGSFRTTEVNDDMTFRNGIALLISTLAISGWTEIFIKRIKKFRINKKQKSLD
ncbi:MAG: hypothetical protein KBA86_01620 [Bacteroidales bacterium]|nr:hypothetical protein [Bacteroidales bacterium]